MRLLKRANLIMEAVRTHQVFEDLTKLQKVRVVLFFLSLEAVVKYRDVTDQKSQESQKKVSKKKIKNCQENQEKSGKMASESVKNSYFDIDIFQTVLWL